MSRDYSQRLEDEDAYLESLFSTANERLLLVLERLRHLGITVQQIVNDIDALKNGMVSIEGKLTTIQGLLEAAKTTGGATVADLEEIEAHVQDGLHVMTDVTNQVDAGELEAEQATGQVPPTPTVPGSTTPPTPVDGTTAPVNPPDTSGSSNATDGSSQQS